MIFKFFIFFGQIFGEILECQIEWVELDLISTIDSVRVANRKLGNSVDTQLYRRTRFGQTFFLAKLEKMF